MVQTTIRSAYQHIALCWHSTAAPLLAELVFLVCNCCLMCGAACINVALSTSACEFELDHINKVAQQHTQAASAHYKRSKALLIL
jgi:hypothetical protein